ncbi:MAG: glycosyltransferase family 39 protein [Syntrophales bacterium]
MNKSDNNRHILLMCLCLVIAVIVVFWRVTYCDFTNYDDNLYVTENAHVENGITTDEILWSFTTIDTGYWHPVTWLSYMLDNQLFGLNPAGYHVINLFFHVANSLLLFLILLRMTNALWQSAFVAGLFALHPLHVESVAWVAERKDVLSTLFWMLTVGAYIFYVKKPELNKYLLALLFFAIGLMAKPMLVTLPFILLLLDYWPLSRIRLAQSPVKESGKSEKKPNQGRKKKGRRQDFLRRLEEPGSFERKPHQMLSISQIVLEKVPFFGLSLASSIVTFLNQQKVGVMASLQSYPDRGY